MFGISDIPKFFLAFFLVLPVISIVHESGHVFFAWLMGGKNIRVTIGTGKTLFRFGILEVRQYYFWYGLCSFENLKRKEKFSQILVFLGGALFNLLGVLAVMILVENDILDPNMFTYQFTYFSLYYIFFALLPMPYPDGNYSDGKITLDLLRNRSSAKAERTYLVQWNREKDQWFVYNHNDTFVKAFDTEEEALRRATEIARDNRPSRVLTRNDGVDKEVQNYPRIPL